MSKPLKTATGRRKTAIARVRLFEGAKAGYEVNGKPLEEYFSSPKQREKISLSLRSK